MLHFFARLLLICTLGSLAPLVSAAGEKLACSSMQVDDFLNAKHLTHLNIETKKSRKWAMNYFKVLLDPTRNIHPDRKKKFKATITASFNNGMTCEFKSKIRINGDWKDHVRDAPALIASLDVKLQSGNIDSVVAFKLLLPHTRNGDNEIFVASLLGKLGFISPKTYYVPTTFNGVNYTYLFQEKARKELLEAHLLREGPILEGDERFAWLNTDKYGVDDRFGLARLGNENWAAKGQTSLNISKHAVSITNNAYLEYMTGKFISESFTGNSEGYGIFLNTDMLGNDSDYARRRNNEYTALLIALHATHALAPHNRKFYFDPTYRQLLPIYYDGDALILDKAPKELPLEYFPSDTTGAERALLALVAIDRKELRDELIKHGLKLSRKEIDRVFSVIEANLKSIIGSRGVTRQVEPRPYFAMYDEVDKFLAFSGERPLEIVVCNFALSNCNTEQLSINDYAALLGGRYMNAAKEHYLYVGTDKNAYAKKLVSPDPLDSTIEKTYDLSGGVKLTTFNSVAVEINQRDKILMLTQLESSGRALLIGGVLSDWQINFQGIMKLGLSQAQRFDENLLTGCLTFLDMRLDNVKINAQTAQCEDAVNLVRNTGVVNSIIIQDAQADALDADFSEITIERIAITAAGNDCFDFSSGDYTVIDSVLKDCSDKAISVGEGSTTRFSSVSVDGANIGIAVKDSSSATIGQASFLNVATCLSANRKKQEFWGSKIKIGEYDCPTGVVVEELGSLIEVSGL